MLHRHPAYMEEGWRRWNATIAPIKHNAMECPKVDLKRRWLPTTGDCPAAAAIGEQPQSKSMPRMRTRRAHVTVNWPFKCQVQFWATLALPIKGPVAPSEPHKMRFIVAFSCRRPPAVHKFLAQTALQLLQLQLRLVVAIGGRSSDHPANKNNCTQKTFRLSLNNLASPKASINWNIIINVRLPLSPIRHTRPRTIHLHALAICSAQFCNLPNALLWHWRAASDLCRIQIRVR